MNGGSGNQEIGYQGIRERELKFAITILRARTKVRYYRVGGGRGGFGGFFQEIF